MSDSEGGGVHREHNPRSKTQSWSHKESKQWLELVHEEIASLPESGLGGPSNDLFWETIHKKHSANGYDRTKSSLKTRWWLVTNKSEKNSAEKNDEESDSGSFEDQVNEKASPHARRQVATRPRRQIAKTRKFQQFSLILSEDEDENGDEDGDNNLSHARRSTSTSLFQRAPRPGPRNIDELVPESYSKDPVRRNVSLDQTTKAFDSLYTNL